MGINIVNIGKRIRYYRVNKKMTQEDLGKAIFVSGKHINYIENGKKAPSLELLISIANTLEASANDLLADNLTMSGNMESQELSDLFQDCNFEERIFLKKTVQAIKKILREHNI